MSDKDLQRVTANGSDIGRGGVRLLSPLVRHHITQKKPIAGHRKLYISHEHPAGTSLGPNGGAVLRI